MIPFDEARFELIRLSAVPWLGEVLIILKLEVKFKKVKFDFIWVLIQENIWV